MEHKTSADLDNSGTSNSFTVSSEENECLHRNKTEDKTETVNCQTDVGNSTNKLTDDGNEESVDVNVEASEATLSEQKNSTEATENHKICPIEHGVVEESEETFETVCEVCLEDEKHVEAFMYCLECEEYLCEHCVTMHRGVRLTRGHTLISKQALHENNSTICMDKKELCQLHISEYLEWFCKTDVSVGCTVCKSTVHGKCKDVIPISEAASSLVADQKVEETVTKLETMKTAIKSVICKGQIREENLAKDRCESLKELEKIKKDIEKTMESLKNLMHKDETKIDQKYLEIKHAIEDDVHQFGQIENTLDRSISTLTNERVKDEYKFIHVIKAEQNLKIIERTLTDFENFKSFPRIAYERDQTSDKKLNSINNVGYIDHEKPLYTLSCQREITVAEETEKSCSILAICLVDSRRLLLSDWQNSSLKLVDATDGNFTSFSIQDYRPFDICRIGDEEKFAVSLLHGREVRFFNISYNSIICSDQSSIETIEKCRGVAYHNSKLFVLCGGCATDNEGPGHVRVYDLNGKLQKTIIQYGICRTVINKPFRLKFKPETDMAFLTDGSKILQMNLNDFEIETVVENLNLKGSLCFDTDGRIIYSNYDKGTVELFARNTKRSMKLLKPDDINRKPRYVEYDAVSSTLFVGLEDSKKLLCFSMEINEWDKAPS